MSTNKHLELVRESLVAVVGEMRANINPAWVGQHVDALEGDARADALAQMRTLLGTPG